MLTNAAMGMPIVILMQLAQTLMETSPVLVILAGLEVERLVQVTLSLFYFLCINAEVLLAYGLFSCLTNASLPILNHAIYTLGSMVCLLLTS